MKDTKLIWMEQVPDEWEKLKLKDYYEFEKGKNAAMYTKEYIAENEGEYSVYSGQTENNGVMGNINTFDYDIGECLFTTTVGAKVMTPKILKGRFSLSQNCLIMKNKQTINNLFMYYMLLTMFDYEKSMIPSYMQPSLRVEDLQKYIFYAPDINKQQKIADYLDKKVNEIDNVIKKTKETIEDYKKYKKSIISENVILGVKNNKELINSRIDYIPKYNKKFNLVKLKNIIKSMESGVSVNAADRTIDNTNEYAVLKTSSVSKNYFDINEHKQVNLDEYNRVSCPVEKNTIIVSRMNTPELVGACGFVNEDVSNIFLPDRLWKVKFKKKHNVKFIWYYLISQYARNYISSLSSGTSSSMQNISQGQFESIFITLPNIDEQNEIVQYLDKVCNEIDNLVSNKEKIVYELEQYKKSLIYEYVTGKKEVI